MSMSFKQWSKNMWKVSYPLKSQIIIHHHNIFLLDGQYKDERKFYR